MRPECVGTPCFQCYFVAKQMNKRATIEEFATTLAEHFCRRYPLVCQHAHHSIMP